MRLRIASFDRRRFLHLDPMVGADAGAFRLKQRRTAVIVSAMNLLFPACAYVDRDADGISAHQGDCNDRDTHIHPDAAELCDLVDNNCDGAVDESASGDFEVWYADADADGYGDPSPTCAGPYITSHYVELSGDCDDQLAEINPGQRELCNDDLDNNCDGQLSECGIDGNSSLGNADFILTGLYPLASGKLSVSIGTSAGDSITDLTLGAGTASVYDDGAGGAWFIQGPLDGRMSIADANSWIYGTQPDQNLGAQVSFSTDLGFGYDDYGEWLISAPGVEGEGGEQGVVYLFFDPARDELLPTDADLRCWGSTMSDGFGTVMEAKWNFGRDYHSDVVIAAPEPDGEGMIEAVYGTNFPYAEDNYADNYGPVAVNEGDYSHFGAALAAGDLDADADSDLIVGAPSYSNQLRHVGAVFGYARLSQPATFAIYGQTDHEQFGFSVSAGGDVNGDGYHDLLIGAPGESEACESDDGSTDASEQPGKTYSFFGPLTGGCDLQQADATFEGVNPNDHAGSAVSVTGDLNGDGFSDILIGAPGYDAAATEDAGAVFVFYGPVAGAAQLIDADAILLGQTPNQSAGVTVLGQDANDDGFGDLITSAIGCPSPCDDLGTVYIVWGGAKL